MRNTDLLLALTAALVLAYLVAELAGRAAGWALRAVVGSDDTIGRTSPRVRRPIRLVRLLVFLLAAAVFSMPALELTGGRPTYGVHLDTLGRWFFASGLRIVLVVVLAYLITRIVALVVGRFERDISQGTDLDVLERGKRARTLGTLIRNVVTAFVFGIATLMILREMRLDITPVLTGAGILGLAVGFGAQTVVRDIIAGFFLILEDQVRVGDVAVINGTGGLVEAINLRTIVLRDVEGAVHVFPNGGVTTLANRSKDYSYYVVDLSVNYREDVDRVIALLRAVGESLAHDPAWQPHILAPIEVFGVDAFGETQFIVKARIKTMPQKQWDVGRELRRRVKLAFDREGIDMWKITLSMPLEGAVKEKSVPGPAPAAQDPEPRM